MEPMTNKSRREFNQSFDVHKPIGEMETLQIWLAYKEEEYAKGRGKQEDN